MVGHARYPALDRARIAAQSRRGSPGPAARRARLPRRCGDGLDGGGGVARDRRHHGRVGTGGARGSRPRTSHGARLVPTRAHLTPARGRAALGLRSESAFRESAARVLALKQRGARPPRRGERGRVFAPFRGGVATRGGERLRSGDTPGAQSASRPRSRRRDAARAFLPPETEHLHDAAGPVDPRSIRPTKRSRRGSAPYQPKRRLDGGKKSSHT